MTFKVLLGEPEQHILRAELTIRTGRGSQLLSAGKVQFRVRDTLASAEGAGAQIHLCIAMGSALCQSWSCLNCVQ